MEKGETMMLLSGTVLPEGICGKVEGFGEGRSGTTSEPNTEGFDANSPGPSGFRAAGAHFVGPLGRCPTSAFAALRVDRLAVRETELLPDSNIMV
jgi:hypothetical protein